MEDIQLHLYHVLIIVANFFIIFIYISMKKKIKILTIEDIINIEIEKIDDFYY